MKQIVLILANSIKHQLRCVAGISLTTREWVRLVGDADGEAITREQAHYTNNYGKFMVRPLQKINMDLQQHVPLPHQPENYLCEDGWVQAYAIKVEDLPQYAETPESLWGGDARVSHAAVVFGGVDVEQSLYLVKVSDLETYWTDDEKRRAKFTYNEIEYDLPCTDPNFSKVHEGELQHTNHLVVSLGENHKDHHYKIIATIL